MSYMRQAPILARASAGDKDQLSFRDFCLRCESKVSTPAVSIGSWERLKFRPKRGPIKCSDWCRFSERVPRSARAETQCGQGGLHKNVSNLVQPGLQPRRQHLGSCEAPAAARLPRHTA